MSLPDLHDLGSGDAMVAALKAIGAARYHDRHQFHRALHDGRLDRGQVQAWALNRYVYQSRIPMKDCALMARVTNPELRMAWGERVFDHDGSREGPGGIGRWLKLCEGVGLDRDYVVSEAGVLPGTRFAVEAYVRYVAERPLLQSIASSLSEMFAPTIIAERVSGMLAHYDFIDDDVLAYFRPRLTQAPRDADFALGYCVANATTAELRRSVCEALMFKCDVLWSQLDALHHAYVLGGGVPPGCFVPQEVLVRVHESVKVG